MSDNVSRSRVNNTDVTTYTANPPYYEGGDETLEAIAISLAQNMSLRANVVSLGLSPNTGNDITTTLQNIINANSNLYFPAGRYIISRPIMLTNNLDILLDQNAEIYLKDNSACRMFDTDPTKTYTNITIKGGIFNGNDANQGPVNLAGGNYAFTNAMRFYSVTNLKVTDTTVRAVRGHGIEHWGCNHVEFGRIYFDQSYDLTNFPNGGSQRDGITGGSSNLYIHDIYGFTDDDMIGFICGVSWGGLAIQGMQNIKIERIVGIPKTDPSSGKVLRSYRGVRIGTANGYTTQNVQVTDISGSFNVNVVLLGGYLSSGANCIGGYLDSLTISDLNNLDFSQQYDEMGIIFNQYCTAKNITIENCTFDLTGTYKQTLFYNANAKINRLNLRNVHFNNTMSPTPTSWSTLIKDTWNDNTNVPSVANNFIDRVNLYNVDYTDNNPNPFTLYRKGSSYTVDNTYPITHIQGSFVSRKTANVIDTGANCYQKFRIDSEFLYYDIRNLLNQQTGDKVLWGNTVYEYLNSGFVAKAKTDVTATTYYSFAPSDDFIWVDATSAAFRIQDNTSYTFPTGYQVTIKRKDSTAGNTPYIQLTSAQIDGSSSAINLGVGATIKLRKRSDGTWTQLAVS